jgi:hypothetical protein
MNSRRRALGGIAVAGLLSLLQPGVSAAANLSGGIDPAFGNAVERVVFHAHGSRATSYYCYPRNYWWFYRPYTTATQGYARCMPYFHYPPRRARSGDMK